MPVYQHIDRIDVRKLALLCGEDSSFCSILDDIWKVEVRDRNPVDQDPLDYDTSSDVMKHLICEKVFELWINKKALRVVDEQGQPLKLQTYTRLSEIRADVLKEDFSIFCDEYQLPKPAFWFSKVRLVSEKYKRQLEELKEIVKALETQARKENNKFDRNDTPGTKKEFAKLLKNYFKTFAVLSDSTLTENYFSTANLKFHRGARPGKNTHMQELFATTFKRDH